jgi:hypothetical protein
VRIAPHVVDTLLLVLGVMMAYQLGISPFSGWLGAKLLALLAYIGFRCADHAGVRPPLQMVGLVGALLSVAYIFVVAYTRDPWPSDRSGPGPAAHTTTAASMTKPRMSTSDAVMWFSQPAPNST